MHMREISDIERARHDTVTVLWNYGGIKLPKGTQLSITLSIWKYEDILRI